MIHSLGHESEARSLSAVLSEDGVAGGHGELVVLSIEGLDVLPALDGAFSFGVLGASEKVVEVLRLGFVAGGLGEVIPVDFQVSASGDRDSQVGFVVIDKAGHHDLLVLSGLSFQEGAFRDVDVGKGHDVQEHVDLVHNVFPSGGQFVFNDEDEVIGLDNTGSRVEEFILTKSALLNFGVEPLLQFLDLVLGRTSIEVHGDGVLLSASESSFPLGNQVLGRESRDDSAEFRLGDMSHSLQAPFVVNVDVGVKDAEDLAVIADSLQVNLSFMGISSLERFSLDGDLEEVVETTSGHLDLIADELHFVFVGMLEHLLGVLAEHGFEVRELDVVGFGLLGQDVEGELDDLGGLGGRLDLEFEGVFSREEPVSDELLVRSKRALVPVGINVDVHLSERIDNTDGLLLQRSGGFFNDHGLLFSFNEDSGLGGPDSVEGDRARLEVEETDFLSRHPDFNTRHP